MIGLTLLIVAVVISVFLEFIKVNARKQRKRLPTWVQIFIPALMSLVLAWIVWSAFALPGAIQIVVLYALAVFLGQYYLSMEIIKRVGKVILKFVMRGKGMTDDEIKEALGG